MLDKALNIAYKAHIRQLGKVTVRKLILDLPM